MNIYKKFYVLLIILFSQQIFSQNDFIVIDSLTKKGLPFVGIYFENTGIYTDENGKFQMNSVNTDSLKVELLGYKSKNISIKTIQDTIYLEKENIKLPSITLQGNKKRIEIPSNKKTRDHSSFPLSPKTTLFSILLPKEKYQDKKLEEITLSFRKDYSTRIRKRYKKNNISAIVRIHIYNIKDEILKSDIYNSDVNEVKLSENQKIKVDLTKENVFFEREGIEIKVEVIKYISDKDISEEIDKTYIRASLTDEENQFFTAETFLKSTFRKENNITPLNEILNYAKKPNKKYYNRNLRIRMILK